MRLYLIRHGKAERDSASGRDEDRQLAPRGERQAVWLGNQLRLADSPPARIMASPAARAARTATLIAESLGLQAETSDAIGLGTRPSWVVSLIAEVAATDGAVPAASLAIVGHNPTLSVVAETLIGGVGNAAQINLRTGEAAVLDLQEPANPIGSSTLVGLLRLGV